MSSPYSPLSNLDAALLGIEDKTNLMQVAGILTFAQPVDIDALKEVLRQRWLTQRRLRQRLVRPDLPLARPYWEDDPHFNLNAHIHRLALPAPGDQTTLQELAGDLVGMPLDFSKPLWHIHVIENYGDGGALLIRLHHAIADGTAVTELLLALTDESAGASLPAAGATAVAANHHKPTDMGEIARQITIAGEMGRRLARRLAITGLDVLSEPEKARHLWEKGAAYTQSALQIALKVAEPETVFSNGVGVRKRVAWSPGLPLTEVQYMRHALGGTVNDLMVTALVGGLRRYMLAQGQSVHGARFRAAIPVSLRRGSGQLGNEFGLIFLSAPLSMADPQERLAEIRARLDQLKQSPDARTTYRLMGALAFVPPGWQNALVKQFGTLATAVISNVPGPTEPRYLAGQRIENVMFWAPQSGRMGLGLTIYSLAGQVYVGVSADQKVMADPNAFIAAFQAEYAAMVTLAKQLSQEEKS